MQIASCPFFNSILHPFLLLALTSLLLKNYLLLEGIVRFVTAGNLAGAAF